MKIDKENKENKESTGTKFWTIYGMILIFIGIVTGTLGLILEKYNALYAITAIICGIYLVLRN